MPGLNAFKARLDPNKVGGTAFIGISRPVIKAHGGSNAEAIENAVGQAIQVAESGITGAIAAHIDKMQASHRINLPKGIDTVTRLPYYFRR